MIKITKGVYGYVTKSGAVKPKTPQDWPFELTPEKEARLVGLGVAEYVGGASPAPADSAEGPEEAPELPEGVTGVPEYNADMKADELRAIAKEMGLTFKPGTTKAKMVEEMDAYIAEHSAGGYDADTGELIDDEDAPAFDPAEAVEA